MMKKSLITIDTNLMDEKNISQIVHAIKGKSIEIACVSVSDREIEGTDIKSLPVKILESGVWDESTWDTFVLGESANEAFVLGESKLGKGSTVSQEAADILEQILKIISSGSFPKQGERENLTKGERNQLRDAMILEAHCREKRDILVSNDTKAYGKPKSTLREELEQRFTRIMTLSEFLQWVASGE